MGQTISSIFSTITNAIMERETRDGINATFSYLNTEAKMREMQKKRGENPEEGITLLQLVAIKGWEDTLEIMFEGLSAEQKFDMLRRRDITNPQEIARYNAFEIVTQCHHNEALNVMLKGLSSHQKNILGAEALESLQREGVITMPTAQATTVVNNVTGNESGVPVVQAYKVGNANTSMGGLQ